MRSEIVIRLPFRLIVADGFGLISGYDGWDYKIVFHQWDLAITGVGWRGESLPVTVVTILANTESVGEAEHPLPNEVIRQFFLATLSYLNRVIDSYRTTEHDYSVRNVFLSDLPPVVDIWFDDYRYLYLVNMPNWIAAEIKEDKTEAMLEIGQTLGTWNRWPQLMTVQRFYVSARHYFEQGNNFNAIIDLETAFEIQVRLTFGMILSHLSVPENDRIKLLKTPLRNIIEDHFAKHLGGEFRYSKPGPINDWYQYLYLLRNKCLHEGDFNVSGEQATIAFAAFLAVQDYIESKLIDKGILEKDGAIHLDKFIPKREIEQYEDAIEERLRKAGFISDETGLIRRKEAPERPDSLG